MEIPESDCQIFSEAGKVGVIFKNKANVIEVLEKAVTGLKLYRNGLREYISKANQSFENALVYVWFAGLDICGFAVLLYSDLGRK